jgi:hypothetical protein
MTRKALIGVLEGDAGDLLLITSILQRELQDCHGQYMEVILKNAGTLLALFGLVANRPGGCDDANARECERRAEKERDPSIKRQLLEEAHRWLALAEYVESQGR